MDLGPRSVVLPAGWQEFWDPKSRKPYFYNQSTCQITWNDPRIPVVPSPVPVGAYCAPQPHNRSALSVSGASGGTHSQFSEGYMAGFLGRQAGTCCTEHDQYRSAPAQLPVQSSSTFVKIPPPPTTCSVGQNFVIFNILHSVF